VPSVAEAAPIRIDNQFLQAIYQQTGRKFCQALTPQAVGDSAGPSTGIPRRLPSTTSELPTCMASLGAARNLAVTSQLAARLTI